MTTATDTRAFVPASEAAEYLQRPAATLSRWRVTGDGPRYWRSHRRVYYDVAALDEWLDEQRREGAR
jgi:hypothetical protein